MSRTSNRGVLILALLAGAGLALFLLVPSLGRPQQSSAFDSLQGQTDQLTTVASTPAAAAADAEDTEEPAVGSAVPAFSTGDLLNLALRLLVVGAVLAGALYLLRFWGQRLRTAHGATGMVRVLDTLGLASGRMIYVIDAGEKVLLVGATQSQISPLGEITDRDTIDALRTAVESPSPYSAGLFDTLRSFTNRSATAPDVPEARAAESPTLQRLMESQAYLRARLNEIQRQYDVGGGGRS